MILRFLVVPFSSRNQEGFILVSPSTSPQSGKPAKAYAPTHKATQNHAKAIRKPAQNKPKPCSTLSKTHKKIRKEPKNGVNPTKHQTKLNQNKIITRSNRSLKSKEHLRSCKAFLGSSELHGFAKPFQLPMPSLVVLMSFKGSQKHLLDGLGKRILAVCTFFRVLK